MATDAQRKTLSADDWASAALDAIADNGVEGLAVERLARTLGVTKGSFYWHFANRGSLLEAALRLWERQQTDDVIARAEVEQDVRVRIDRLFRGADGSKRAGQLYLAFAGASADPLVGAVVRRVNARRIRFMTTCYTAMGMSAEEARQRAVLAYSVYLGTLQLRRDAPELIPTGPEFHAYMDSISEVLIPGFRPSMRASSIPGTEGLS